MAVKKNILPFYIASSVEELVKNHTEGIEIDKNYSIFHYLSTSNNLVKQADIYESEGDIERTYIYLLRFCILTLEKLPNHPDYRKDTFRKSSGEIKSKALSKLKELEGLKVILSQGYELINKKKQDERAKRENENKIKKEEDRIKREKELEDKLRLEKEQQLNREKEQKEKELESEILRIIEVEDLVNRKQMTEKNIKKINVQRQFELLRQEAALEERRRLEAIEKEKNTLALEERRRLEAIEELDRAHKQQLLQQEAEEKARLEKEEQLRLASLPPPPPDYSSFDLDILDKKSSSLSSPNNINSEEFVDNGFLLDPSFLPPPPPIIEKKEPIITKPILQQPIIPTQPSHLPNNEKKLPPIHTSTSPIQFGYPSLSNNNSNNNPPPLSLHNNNIQNNGNNNIPFIQQYKSPPLNNNNNNNIKPLLHNNNIQQYQQPQQYHQQPQQYHQQPQFKLPQYQPIQGKPINANGLQIQYQPPQSPSTITTATNSPTTTANKPNIDSSEASKKYSKLRKIVVHGEAFQEFMRLAENNTRKHIETCGILSGTLSNDVFRITTIIIPKQEGTTDTCNTIEEHEIFEYQLENDLLTLGWIHTHPTQDCFLSAVDVHTHCSYQYLLQEAIAVVISPMANPNFGIFRLTDPPGLETVQKCKLKSFHPHPPVNGVPIYTKCEHVDLIWGKKSDSKVIDLRFK